MRSHTARFSVLLIGCALLLSCSGYRDARKDVRRTGDRYDEAIYRGHPLKELEILSIKPFFSNVEYIDRVTTRWRTECGVVVTADNVSAYDIPGVRVKAFVVMDRDSVMFPHRDTTVTVMSTKYRAVKVEDAGKAGGLMEKTPVTRVVKIGDEFPIDAHDHVQFNVRCTLDLPAEKEERLTAIVIIADGAGRVRIVRSDPIPVEQWKKDWGF